MIRLWSSVLHAFFYGYTAYGLVRYLFDDTWVTRDEIFAVGANFTVVAWGFAYLFVAVQVLYPGSFVVYQGRGFAARSSSCSTCPSRRSPASGCRTSSPVLPHGALRASSSRSWACCTSRSIVARVVGLTIAAPALGRRSRSSCRRSPGSARAAPAGPSRPASASRMTRSDVAAGRAWRGRRRTSRGRRARRAAAGSR